MTRSDSETEQAQQAAQEQSDESAQGRTLWIVDDRDDTIQLGSWIDNKEEEESDEEEDWDSVSEDDELWDGDDEDDQDEEELLHEESDDEEKGGDDVPEDDETANDESSLGLWDSEDDTDGWDWDDDEEEEKDEDDDDDEEDEDDDEEEDDEADDDDESVHAGAYFVESIRGHMLKDNGLWFVVKWLDWPESDNTTEPLVHLLSVVDLLWCGFLLVDYFRARQLAPPQELSDAVASSTKSQATVIVY